MRLIKMVCPSCGAQLTIDMDNKQAFCQHCGTALLIDDEVQHVHYDNAEEAGYHFEKGRQKAAEEKQKEEEQAAQRRMEEQRAQQFRAQQMAEQERKKKAKTAGTVFFIIIAVVLVAMICTCAGCLRSCGVTSSTDNVVSLAKDGSSSSVWAQDFASIEDFDYKVMDDELTLTDYKSLKKKVKINATYVIDGKERKLVALDGTFALDNVDSVIVPEGVKKLSNNTFNSCGIEYLYLPASLEEVGSGFWNYFHDMKKIYYGGTEEQWNELCKVERGKIDVQEIIFNANVNDLK